MYIILANVYTNRGGVGGCGAGSQCCYTNTAD